jgi:hypothetical protein
MTKPPVHCCIINCTMPAHTHTDGHVFTADTRCMKTMQDKRECLGNRRPTRRVVDHNRHR